MKTHFLIKPKYAIQFDGEDHWINFKIVEVISDSKDVFINYDNGRGYEPESNITFEEAYQNNKLCEGFIKWDGCMELHDLNYHFCGYSYVLQDVIRDIYIIAKELMPQFDEDLAAFSRITKEQRLDPGEHPISNTYC